MTRVMMLKASMETYKSPGETNSPLRFDFRLLSLSFSEKKEIHHLLPCQRFSRPFIRFRWIFRGKRRKTRLILYESSHRESIRILCFLFQFSNWNSRLFLLHKILILPFTQKRCQSCATMAAKEIREEEEEKRKKQR